MSKWIWRFGEFEIWHNLLVHTRRQAYGFPEPPIWKVHMPDPVVRFVKETETEGGKIRISDILYPGVAVTVNSIMRNFQSEVRGCTLYVDDDDEVTIGPY